MADDPITTDLTRFVRALSTAYKSLLLYSLAHPRGREGANGAYDLLTGLLDRLPEISLGVAEGRVVIEENVIEKKDPVAARLVEALDARGIDSLSLRRGIDREEFIRFLQLFLLKPEKVAELGGYAEILANRRIAHVALNDVRYGRISEADGLLDIALADQLFSGGGGGGGGGGVGALRAGMPLAEQIFTETAPLAMFQQLLSEQQQGGIAGPGGAGGPAEGAGGPAEGAGEPEAGTGASVGGTGEAGGPGEGAVAGAATLAGAGGPGPAGAPSSPTGLREAASQLSRSELRFRGGGIAPEMLVSEPHAASMAFLGLLEDMRRQGMLSGGLVQATSVVEAIEDLGRQLLAKSEGDWKQLRVVIARLILSLKPELQSLLIDRAASPEARQSFLKRILALFPPERLGELVAGQYRQGLRDPEAIEALIRKLVPDGPTRKASLKSIGAALAEAGMEPASYKVITDNILWKELPHHTKVQFLLQSRNLWNVSFDKIEEVIRDLLGAGEPKTAVTVIRRYFSGLLVYDRKSRSSVVRNGFRFYRLVGEDARLTPLRRNIADLLLEHLKNEESADLYEELCRTLASIVRLEFDQDNYRVVLYLHQAARGLVQSGRLGGEPRAAILERELRRVEEPRVLERLLEAFVEGDSEAEEVVPRVFGLLGPEAHQFLITALASETSRRQRARLVTLLRQVGVTLVEPLRLALNDERWYLVRNALFLLGDLGGPEHVEDAERCLVHPDARVRREVCRALPKLAGKETEPLLVRALNDPDETVVAAAVDALGGLASERGISYMLDLVAHRGVFADAGDALRKTAIEVLGRLRVGAATELLEDILLRSTLLSRSDSPRIRAAAVQALASIRTPEALDLLERVASGDTSRRLRNAAHSALQRARRAASDR
jgi:HEAT repeat protein